MYMIINKIIYYRNNLRESGRWTARCPKKIP